MSKKLFYLCKQKQTGSFRYGAKNQKTRRGEGRDIHQTQGYAVELKYAGPLGHKYIYPQNGVLIRPSFDKLRDRYAIK